MLLSSIPMIMANNKGLSVRCFHALLQPCKHSQQTCAKALQHAVGNRSHHLWRHDVCVCLMAMQIIRPAAVEQQNVRQDRALIVDAMGCAHQQAARNQVDSVPHVQARQCDDTSEWFHLVTVLVWTCRDYTECMILGIRHLSSAV